MARIYLDARNITSNPSGVARYASALIAELVRQAPEHDFVAIRHRSNQDPLVVNGCDNLEEIHVDCPIDGMQNFAFGHRTLQAAFARGGEPDLYHTLFHMLPAKTRSIIGDRPVVTTLHDFVWLDHPDASQPTFFKARSIQAFARMSIPRALRTSDRVIAISEPTRRRARSFVADEKMTTISHGVDASFFESPPMPTGEFAELLDPDRPYVVAIGNDKEYKNLALLVDAFEKLCDEGLSARLVLVGNCQGLNTRIAHKDFSEWVTLTEFVGDETLRRILGHARAFAFPSKVEGFGLPILEAMAMGVPTIVADVEPMRSIADEAALLVDPDDAEQLSHLLMRILTDDDLADRLAVRGRRRASQFRWPDTARRTLDVYEELLS